MKFNIGKYTISKLGKLNWVIREKISSPERGKKIVDANHHPTPQKRLSTLKTRYKSILVGYYNSLLTAKQELAEYVALNDCKDYKELCKWINKIKSIK